MDSSVEEEGGVMEAMKRDQVGYDWKSSRMERMVGRGAEMWMVVSMTRDGGCDGFDMLCVLSPR